MIENALKNYAGTLGGAASCAWAIGTCSDRGPGLGESQSTTNRKAGPKRWQKIEEKTADNCGG